MRTVFQVVATMVAANAAVAFGADAKAKTTPQESKAKATEAQVTTTAQATDAKGDSKETEKAGDASASAAPLILPESAVLPEGVVRLRGVVGAATATTGFDRDAKSIDLGAKLKATVGAGVLEFAITDKISGQILVPFRSAANFEVTDDAKFRDYVKQTSAYKDFYAQATAYAKKNLSLLVADTVSKKVKAAGLPDAVALQQASLAKTAIENALANNTPFSDDIPLTALGLGTIKKGQNLNDEIDRILLDAGVETAKSRGIATGIGDIEVGAKYAFSTVKEPMLEGVPFYASLGLGVRLNSGHFKSAAVDNKAATGRGTTDLGLRVNADYNIVDGLQFQFENQSEMMIQKGKTYKPAATAGFAVAGITDYDTGKLYTAGTDVDYERTGMRQVGYTKLVFAPGVFSSSLNPLKINAKYSYDYDAKVKIDGVEQKDDPTRSTSVALGLGLDGLQVGLPFQADIDYVMPVSGRNVGFASKVNVGTLKLYYKF